MNTLLHQVTNHAFHISAYIAYFGKLGRLHLGERCICNLGQAACDLRFSYARAPNKQDIVRHNVFLDIRRDHHASNAIAQSNGHIALGILLTYDVLIKLFDNLSGGEVKGIKHLLERVVGYQYNRKSSTLPRIRRKE